MSDFSAINVALTGLRAAQQAIDTTGENVANANTPGYTRERVDVSAIGTNMVPGVWSHTTLAAGGGVVATAIERLGDAVLEARNMGDHAASADLTLTNQILSNVQSAFSDPGPNGLSTALADFWSSWDDVANNPTDIATRNALIGKAQTVMDGFNTAASAVQTAWEGSLQQTQTTVSQVNTTAATIADLNAKIQAGTQTGLNVNALVDQRQQALLQLGQLAGVTTRNQPDGTTDVYLGTNRLVAGTTASTLAVNATPSGVQIQWGNATIASPAITSGQLHALTTALNVTLSGYASSLSNVAAAWVQAVNSQQSSGFTLATATSPSQAGPPMLALTQALGPNAGEPPIPHLALAAGFAPEQIAAASSPNAPGDGTNAQAAAELGTGVGSADSQYRSFINILGSDVQRSSAQLGVQNAVTSQSDGALQSAEGVNTDEEMANMVAFQHAYSASARVLTTIDSMLDTLINHTGLTT